MTTANRTYTFEFSNGVVETGKNWGEIIDDNNFFDAEINSMSKMAVGESIDCDFVVVTRTS